MATSEPETTSEGHTEAFTGPDGLRTDILAGSFTLTADEPPSVEGGTGEGPTPYDFLAAALGACTSMTLRMYADRKEWPLEEASVQVRHRKIHAQDCEHCLTQEGKIDQLERKVTLVGPLSEEQRQRLLEIANRCPVHQTLKGEIDITTQLDAASAST